MGLEWHDRRRDLRGRFERGYDLLTDQLHIRCSRTEGQQIRHAALTDGMELSAWCREMLTAAAKRRLTGDGTQHV